ncbi:hypothetical protein EV424DRAFT_1558102 [Suillus variegatus]|nr:hypothetical protein EV424DRAFT_1558102 [Suillus variegatus]
MTLVSDDPSWLPTINFFYLSSYFVVSRSNLGFCVAVVASVMVIYDWVLTLGREVELVWVVCELGWDLQQQGREDDVQVLRLVGFHRRAEVAYALWGDDSGYRRKVRGR